MSDIATQQTMSDLDFATYVVSFASLVGSAYSARLLVPSIGPGLYGGTAVFVGMILFFQIVVLVLAVGVPTLVLLLRRRFRLSRTAVVLLAVALTGVVAEGIALAIIPITGNC
jgi:hypothetical protein